MSFSSNCHITAGLLAAIAARGAHTQEISLLRRLLLSFRCISSSPLQHPRPARCPAAAAAAAQCNSGSSSSDDGGVAYRSDSFASRSTWDCRGRVYRSRNSSKCSSNTLGRRRVDKGSSLYYPPLSTHSSCCFLSPPAGAQKVAAARGSLAAAAAASTTHAAAAKASSLAARSTSFAPSKEEASAAHCGSVAASVSAEINTASAYVRLLSPRTRTAATSAACDYASARTVASMPLSFFPWSPRGSARAFTAAAAAAAEAAGTAGGSHDGSSEHSHRGSESEKGARSLSAASATLLLGLTASSSSSSNDSESSLSESTIIGSQGQSRRISSALLLMQKEKNAFASRSEAAAAAASGRSADLIRCCSSAAAPLDARLHSPDYTHISTSVAAAAASRYGAETAYSCIPADAAGDRAAEASNEIISLSASAAASSSSADSLSLSVCSAAAAAAATNALSSADIASHIIASSRGVSDVSAAPSSAAVPSFADAAAAAQTSGGIKSVPTSCLLLLEDAALSPAAAAAAASAAAPGSSTSDSPAGNAAAAVAPSPALAAASSRGLYQELTADSALQLFSGSAHPELAREIAAHLNVSLGRVQLGRFVDGECLVRVLDEVRGRDVFVIQSAPAAGGDLHSSLVEIFLLLTTIRRSSAKRVTAVMPYFPYERETKSKGQREDICTPMAAADLAVLLQVCGADAVIFVDVHNPRVEGFFTLADEPPIPMSNIDPHGLAAQYLQKKDLVKPVVVATDNTAGEKASSMWKIMKEYGINASYTSMVCDAPKRQVREGTPLWPPSFAAASAGGAFTPRAAAAAAADTEQQQQQQQEEQQEQLVVDASARDKDELKNWNLVGAVEGCDCVIIDDIIDTGEKAEATARDLKAGGARRIFMFASHGILSKGAVDRINNSPIEEVVVTNTVPIPPHIYCEKLVVLSVGKLLAEAIKRIHEDQSVSILCSSESKTPNT